MVDLGKLLEPVTRMNQRRSAPLVLELDLTEGVLDEPPADPLGQILAMRRPQLADLVAGIRRGAADPKVKGLIAVLGGRPVNLAAIQELRDALRDFSKAGKPTLAWASSLGDVSAGTLPYYLACACDEVVVQPTGTVGLTGVAVVNPFLRDALDKLGVEYETGARHEYKSAINTFTERGYTEPQREATTRIVESVSEQVTAGVADGRGLDAEQARSLIGQGPYLADEALAKGLVDRTAYRDEAYKEFRGRFAEGSAEPHLQYVNRYNRIPGLLNRLPAAPRGDYVALISGSGPIMPGRSRRTPGGSSTMGADTVAGAFRAARQDDRVRAVVFRVNSPGGSHVASDTIWREVALTEEAGTPVVVSMGEVAGSGGYFVSLGAKSIVAQPGTLTGSIGVFLGKPVVRDLLEKLGISIDSVEAGDHARMFSPERAFSEAEWERVNTLLDSIYDDFTGKVAQARGMSREQVHEVARGRVWTGKDAWERGLVDELGGTEAAVALARKRAKLPKSAQVTPYPRLNPVERLIPAESSEDRAATMGASALRADAWGSLAGVSARLGLPAAGPLTMPGHWEIR